MENSIEVPAPRDAKGCEVPLNINVMYDDKGVEYSVCCLIFRNMTEICEAGWTVELATAENKVRQVSLDCMYIDEPDSWEKLLEDLKAVEDYGNSSHLDGPACHYTHTVGKQCDKCKFYRSRSCIGEMCANIAYRIRELRGEDE